MLLDIWKMRTGRTSAQALVSSRRRRDLGEHRSNHDSDLFHSKAYCCRTDSRFRAI